MFNVQNFLLLEKKVKLSRTQTATMPYYDVYEADQLNEYFN